MSNDRRGNSSAGTERGTSPISSATTTTTSASERKASDTAAASRKSSAGSTALRQAKSAVSATKRLPSVRSKTISNHYDQPAVQQELNRDEEIDRIYGTGRAGQSVRHRMAGTFLENPFAEQFTQALWADVAETRTGEHLERQRQYRTVISSHLEKEKDFIIDRGRAVKKELKILKETSSAPDLIGKAAPRVTITEVVGTAGGDDDADDLHLPNGYPKSLTAADRKALVNDLIRRMPAETEHLQRKKEDLEYKLYHQRVAYRNQFGPATYAPWQKEHADMIRKLVYELVDRVIDGYEGPKQVTPSYQQDLQQQTIDIKEKAAIQLHAKEKTQNQRLRRIDNAILEKTVHLEGENIIFEITRQLVAEIGVEEMELIRLCQEIARSSTATIAWALANPKAATKAALPETKTLRRLEQAYNDFLHHQT